MVEGPSDELLLKKIYLQQHGKLPEIDGIDIIVVRGIGFKHYLEIAKHIGTEVHVVKDNDGSYQKNIIDYASDYPEKNISFFSDADDTLRSLEPSLIHSNAKNDKALLALAKIALSSQEFNKLKVLNGLDEKKAHFTAVYVGENGDKNNGSKKVDSAIRIFDSEEQIQYPDYLLEALKFD